MKLKQIAALMSEDVPQIVSVGLTRNGKILAGRRRDSGKWCLPGGHMESGETPTEAAIRELKEETGIAMGQLTMLKASRFNSPRTGKDIIVYGFTHESKGYVPFATLDPDKEFSEFKWLDLNDSPEFSDWHHPDDIVLSILRESRMSRLSRSINVDSLVAQYGGEWKGWRADRQIVIFPGASQSKADQFANEVRKLPEVVRAEVGLIGRDICVSIRWSRESRMSDGRKYYVDRGGGLTSRISEAFVFQYEEEAKRQAHGWRAKVIRHGAGWIIVVYQR